MLPPINTATPFCWRCCWCNRTAVTLPHTLRAQVKPAEPTALLSLTAAKTSPPQLAGFVAWPGVLLLCYCCSQQSRHLLPTADTPPSAHTADIPPKPRPHNVAAQHTQHNRCSCCCCCSCCSPPPALPPLPSQNHNPLHWNITKRRPVLLPVLLFLSHLELLLALLLDQVHVN